MERLRIEGLRSPLAGPFDLALQPGECVSIAGPSGSGKTLFLRMIADLDPNDGHAWLDGRDRRAMSAPHWRRRVTYVAAESGWWAERVSEHFPPPSLGTVRSLAERLALKPELMDGSVARLSTGEKQRLSLIRALVLDPPVLLLDEPTGPLDEDSTARAEALLRERLAGSTSILMVTHAPEQARRMASRHFRMSQGQLSPA